MWQEAGEELWCGGSPTPRLLPGLTTKAPSRPTAPPGARRGYEGAAPHLGGCCGAGGSSGAGGHPRSLPPAPQPGEGTAGCRGDGSAAAVPPAPSRRLARGEAAPRPAPPSHRVGDPPRAVGTPGAAGTPPRSRDPPRSGEPPGRQRGPPRPSPGRRPRSRPRPPRGKLWRAPAAARPAPRLPGKAAFCLLSGGVNQPRLKNPGSRRAPESERGAPRARRCRRAAPCPAPEAAAGVGAAHAFSRSFPGCCSSR